MNDTSPLFVSSLELLAHAAELYISGDTKKHKFIVLHLANAVELILKDRLVSKGVTIYKNQGETINIWASVSELKKVEIEIKELPIIHLLVDDRNTIQHRYGFPNAETVYYYVSNIVAFFKRFMMDEYNVDLSEALSNYLSGDNLKFLGLIPDEITYLNRLFGVSPESAIIQAFSFIQQEFYTILSPNMAATNPYTYLAQQIPIQLEELKKAGFLNIDAVKGFRVLRDIRNKAAHSSGVTNGVTNNDPSWKKAKDIAITIITAIKTAREAGYFSQAKPSETDVVLNNKVDGIQAEGKEPS